MKLFLIGLPGSGKSTLAKELSKKLSYTLIDTDDLICKKEGGTIEEIFSKKGETYFRKLESDTLKELKTTGDAIISTGGGLPCFYDNMKFINANGLSIFLNVPIKDIVKRLMESPDQNRPMLKGKNREQIIKFLEEKLEERLPYYSKASVEFTDPSVNADKIVDEILKQGLL